MKKIFKFIFVLFGIFIAISVVSGIYQGVTGKDLSPKVSDEYQSQYDEKYFYYINLSYGELIPIGIGNIYDEQDKPNLEKAKEWCSSFVFMENVSRELDGRPFSEEEFNGAVDGCADAFMEKA